jgi:pimeloyl-ACP methyl ester carboxylesterase
MVVVGHSLGGAIAAYISLRRANVAAYMFNTSIRTTRGDNPQVNARYAVSQYGEILVALRRLWINPGGTYTVINCNDGSSLDRHDIRPLAECLTSIAAWNPMSGAAESLVANHLPAKHQIFEPDQPVSLDPSTK